MTNRWCPAPLAAGSLAGALRKRAGKAEVSPLPQISGLLQLQNKFLRHCFRLQQHQLRLSEQAQRGKRGSGRKIVQQIELERQRLGRELHTGVGQMLAATRLQLETIAAHMPNPPAAVKQALERLDTLTGQALEQVRSVSRRTHPPEWQRLALADALQQLWDTSGVPERYQAALRIGRVEEPELEVKILFYRALQEALSNLARHSRATAIEAALESREDLLVLTVRDNGVGFDAGRLLAAPPSITAGIGLRSIREQAAALEGHLNVESGPGGTMLVLGVPYPKSLP